MMNRLFFLVVVVVGLSSSCKTLSPATNQSSLLGHVSAFDEVDRRHQEAKIAGRFSDPDHRQVLSTHSTYQLIGLFNESHNLIDRHHYSPIGLKARVLYSLNALHLVVRNSAIVKHFAIETQQSSHISRTISQLAKNFRTGTTPLSQLLQQLSNLGGTQNPQFGHYLLYEFWQFSIESVDRYASFIPEPTNPDEDHATGRFTGIGVSIKAATEGIQLIEVYRGAAAHRAGLRAGDLITAIDGQSLTGSSTDKVIGKIKQAAGRSINFTVERQSKTAAVRVRPGPYTRPTIFSDAYFAKDRVAYWHVGRWTASAGREFTEAYNELIDRHYDPLPANERVRGLIIDLRQNPGGRFRPTIEACDKFLDDGCIVSSVNHRLGTKSAFDATRRGTTNIPLVVIVDSNSASASEIFAAAIKEHSRGIIVGRHTYCKGSVQEYRPIGRGVGQLKFTVEIYCDPKDRPMVGRGVAPDVKVPNDTIRWGDPSDLDIKSAIDEIVSGRAAALLTK